MIKLDILQPQLQLLIAIFSKRSKVWFFAIFSIFNGFIHYDPMHTAYMHEVIIIININLQQYYYWHYCWFVRGRIKEKIGTIYVIKYQVYCMENTAQWSVNTIQLFNFSLRKQPPLIILARLYGFLSLLKWIDKGIQQQ